MGSLLLALVIGFNFLPSGVLADDAAGQEKISLRLQEAIASLAEGETLPVYVWLQDIDHDAVEQDVQEKTGLSIDSIQLDVETIAVDRVKAANMEQANLQITAVMNRNKIVMEQKKLRTDTYISARREEYRTQYRRNNEQDMQRLQVEEKDILFQSEYSPMNIVELSAEEILEAAQDSRVVSLDLFEQSILEDQSISSSMETVEADFSVTVLTGEGVTIGMIETGVPDVDDSDLDGKVTALNTNVTQHATIVAKIIHAMAPDANIVAVAAGSNTEHYIGIEQLISAGISVINMSAGWGRSDTWDDYWYSPEEEWFDHISNVHKVTFVCAAGNNGFVGNGDIVSPAMAYNVITVGAVDDQNTGSVLTDDFLMPTSSTGNGEEDGCAKPDVVAPGIGPTYYDVETQGYEISSGTSCAAPIVTGLVAQMMEYDSTLKGQAMVVKAIILACCDRKVSSDNTETMAEGLTEEQGAGVVNAMRMCTILVNESYETGSFTNTSHNIDFSPYAVGNVAMAYRRANGISSSVSHTSGTVTVWSYINVDMHFYPPTGNSFTSDLVLSSTEVAYMDNITTGTYRVQLEKIDSDLIRTIFYGLAWY